MLEGLSFWSSWIHYAATAVHIFAGVFWLGWMAFMFGILAPVVRRVAPERTARIQGQIQQRIRRTVFWIIPVLILTGLYNMGYHGLLSTSVLLDTARGHRMLAKLGAASVLFGVYYTAPFLLRLSHDGSGGHDPTDCHGNPDPLVRRTSAVLHVLAFAAGVTAAVLGVSLGA